MKKINATIAILAYLASWSAFAHHGGNQPPLPTSADSWAIILASKNVAVQQSVLHEAFGAQGYFNACVAGDKLRTIQPLRVCAEQHIVYGTSGGGGEGDGGMSSWYECSRYVDKVVEIPLAQTAQTTCAKWRYEYSGGGEGDGGTNMICERYNTVNYTLPLNPEFNVFAYEWTYFSGGEGDSSSNYTPTKLIFKKNFQIPVCN